MEKEVIKLLEDIKRNQEEQMATGKEIATLYKRIVKRGVRMLFVLFFFLLFMVLLPLFR